MGRTIKTFLLILINKVILKTGDFIVKCNKIYQIQKIRKNKDILIGKNVYIHPSSRLEVINGGTIQIGDNTEILQGVLIITYGGTILIGSNCKINPYTIIYGLGGTKIGDDVLVAGHTMIVPDNHNFNDINTPINIQGSKRKGIIIDNNVWIGHGCSILDAVFIESGAIIAAGSVVNKNVLKNTIVGGVPAKFIKERK